MSDPTRTDAHQTIVGIVRELKKIAGDATHVPVSMSLLDLIESLAQGDTELDTQEQAALDSYSRSKLRGTIRELEANTIHWIDPFLEPPQPWLVVLMALDNGEVTLGSRATAPGVWFIGDDKSVGRRCHEKVIRWAERPKAPTP